MSLRTLVSLTLAALVACGGDGDDGTEAECGPIDVDVTVTDPTGAPIEGADVNVDNEMDCTDGGGGAYACSVPGPGDYNLYALLTPDYDPYGSQFTASCDANPMSIAVTLNYESGGL